MKGESRSGVSQEANSAALTVRVGLHLAPLAQQAGQPADDFADRREFLPAPAGRDRGRDQRQLGGDQRRGDAAPAGSPGRRGSGRPSGCARASATCARGRRTRSRGRRPPRARSRARRPQPQPQREVDVLVVEEEALGEAADLLPGAARDRQAGAGERRHLAGRGRLRDRPPVPPGPDDPGEVDRVAGGVDRASPRDRRPAPARRPSRAPRARGAGSPRRSRAAAPRRG